MGGAATKIIFGKRVLAARPGVSRAVSAMQGHFWKGAFDQFLQLSLSRATTDALGPPPCAALMDHGGSLCDVKCYMGHFSEASAHAHRNATATQTQAPRCGALDLGFLAALKAYAGVSGLSPLRTRQRGTCRCTLGPDSSSPNSEPQYIGIPKSVIVCLTSKSSI